MKSAQFLSIISNTKIFTYPEEFIYLMKLASIKEVECIVRAFSENNNEGSCSSISNCNDCPIFSHKSRLKAEKYYLNCKAIFNRKEFIYNYDGDFTLLLEIKRFIDDKIN